MTSSAWCGPKKPVPSYTISKVASRWAVFQVAKVRPLAKFRTLGAARGMVTSLVESGLGAK